MVKEQVLCKIVPHPNPGSEPATWMPAMAASESVQKAIAKPAL